MTIHIRNRAVGSEHPVFIIAEIGVNHDGSMDRALELVHIARDCGADCVKLQVFQAEKLMHRSSKFAEYQQGRSDAADPTKMLQEYELSVQEQERVIQEIEGAGMIPLATPFSPDDVETIEFLNLPAIKIASPDLVNYPLLSRCAQSNLPLIVSTGAATMEEVRMSAEWLLRMDSTFAMMHCVSSYPTPLEQANLAWIDQLHRATNVPVGYSDHTTEILAGAMSVVAGACIVEKHLTYDQSAAGPDHSASADAAQFAEYVKLIRTAEKLRGGGSKRVLPIERDVRTVSRQSLVLQAKLEPGEMLCEQHLTVQRPGTGIPAAMLTQALGKRARQLLSPGTLLQWDMLSDAA